MDPETGDNHHSRPGWDFKTSTATGRRRREQQPRETTTPATTSVAGKPLLLLFASFILVSVLWSILLTFQHDQSGALFDLVDIQNKIELLTHAGPHPSSLRDQIGSTLTGGKSSQRPKKLGDGCFHVFLDAGANIGTHTRFLMEPHLYPNAKTAQTAFTKAFGPPSTRDPRDICSFGFEPNPKHIDRQRNLSTSYAAMGWRYTHIHAGLGDTVGSNITFYHNDGTSSKNPETGFSVVNRRSAGGDDNRRAEVVPLIHFARWIQDHIIDRQMPTTVYGTYDEQYSHNDGTEGKVALKLDIEGSEFLVAPNLIYTGVMCRIIDLIWGEYHTVDWAPSRDAMEESTGQGAFKLTGTWQVARDYYNNLWNVMKSINPDDCRARFLDLPDEENYMFDGMPFPTP